MESASIANLAELFAHPLIEELWWGEQFGMAYSNCAYLRQMIDSLAIEEKYQALRYFKKVETKLHAKHGKRRAILSISFSGIKMKHTAEGLPIVVSYRDL